MIKDKEKGSVTHGEKMREVISEQLKIGQVAIEDIKINMRSRDEIPKTLAGLKEIYCNDDLRTKVFSLLEEMIPSTTNKTTGRPGMGFWKIMVLGCIRLNCNWDYDKLQEIVNHHNVLRQMLGHSLYDDDYEYPLQTLKDNISLFTPEILKKINKVVVEYGIDVYGKKKLKNYQK